MTHDYKRNRTTTLFAALNVLDGQVIAQCQQRHRHIEWLKFLRQIERETPCWRRLGGVPLMAATCTGERRGSWPLIVDALYQAVIGPA